MSAQPFTLGGVNARLRALGFPVIDPNVAKKIKAAASASDFQRALDAADSNPSAKNWLTRLLQHVGVRTQAQADKKPVPRPSASQASAPQRTASAAPVEDGATNRAPSPNDDRDYVSFHIYGGNAALCFGADKTRSDFHTVYLDAALAVGERKYNWKERIRIQLTRSELPVVAAVLLGYLPHAEFQNHGEYKAKGFSLEIQQNKIFAKVWEKGAKIRAVPIPLEEGFWVAGLFLRQIGRAFEGGAEVPLALLLQRYAALKPGR